MKLETKTSAVVVLGLILSGCGGGGGASVEPTPDYATLMANADAMEADAYLDSNSDPIPPRTQLPTSGTADYKGYVRGDVGSAGLIGDLTLTANFGSAAIDYAKADSFVTEGDQVLTGVVDTNGPVQFAGPKVALTMDGTVDGQASTIVLYGDFYGGTNDINTVPLSVGGSATGTGATDLSNGTFIATQQP